MKASWRLRPWGQCRAVVGHSHLCLASVAARGPAPPATTHRPQPDSHQQGRAAAGGMSSTEGRAALVPWRLQLSKGQARSRESEGKTRQAWAGDSTPCISVISRVVALRAPVVPKVG